MNKDINIDIQTIERARSELPDYIRYTEINESVELSKLTGVPVYLKLENQQITNSFKIRGASYAISQLNTNEKNAGVVCVSTGNHGRGISFAAKKAQINANIYMTSLVPSIKIDAIRELGGTINIIDSSQEDAELAALEYCEKTGAAYLSPFDNQNIICGQASVGLEILEQIKDVEHVIVPLSGGGLISGIALAIKAKRPQCQVLGATMDQGAAMVESLKAGHPVGVDEKPTFADSLGGGIGLDNQYTFDIVNRHADNTALVSEKQIADAIRHAYFHERQIIEGGASVALASVLTEKFNLNGPTVVVLSGANIDMCLHSQIIQGLCRIEDRTNTV